MYASICVVRLTDVSSISVHHSQYVHLGFRSQHCTRGCSSPCRVIDTATVQSHDLSTTLRVRLTWAPMLDRFCEILLPYSRYSLVHIPVRFTTYDHQSSRPRDFRFRLPDEFGELLARSTFQWLSRLTLPTRQASLINSGGAVYV